MWLSYGNQSLRRCLQLVFEALLTRHFHLFIKTKQDEVSFQFQASLKTLVLLLDLPWLPILAAIAPAAAACCCSAPAGLHQLNICCNPRQPLTAAWSVLPGKGQPCGVHPRLRHLHYCLRRNRQDVVGNKLNVCMLGTQCVNVCGDTT